MQRYDESTRRSERDEERQRLRPFLRQYLESRGIDTHKNFRCLSPEHEDRNPSMSYDPTHDRVWCRACGVRYDLFDLIAQEIGKPAADREVFEETRRRYGHGFSFSPAAGAPAGAAPRALDWNEEISVEKPQPENFTAYFLKCAERLSMTDYPQRRGLTAETCACFGLGFDPSWHHPNSTVHTQRLIIPTSRSSYTARDVRPPEMIPEYQKAYQKQKVGTANIYLAHRLYKQELPAPCVVEGELDALSIIQTGGNAVALRSTTNTGRFAKLVKARRPAKPLYLLMDSDKWGQTALEELVRELSAAGIPHYIGRIPAGCNDANDLLLSDPAHLCALLEVTMR